MSSLANYQWYGELSAICKCCHCVGTYKKLLMFNFHMHKHIQKVTYTKLCNFILFLVSISKAVSGSCSDLKCIHGATCQEKDGLAQCTCAIACAPVESKDAVCGSDGNTYGSECQLRTFSCRYQKPISVAVDGPCKRGGQSECLFGALGYVSSLKSQCSSVSNILLIRTSTRLKFGMSWTKIQYLPYMWCHALYVPPFYLWRRT